MRVASIRCTESNWRMQSSNVSKAIGERSLQTSQAAKMAMPSKDRLRFGFRARESELSVLVGDEAEGGHSRPCSSVVVGSPDVLGPGGLRPGCTGELGESTCTLVVDDVAEPMADAPPDPGSIVDGSGPQIGLEADVRFAHPFGRPSGRRQKAGDASPFPK